MVHVQTLTSAEAHHAAHMRHVSTSKVATSVSAAKDTSVKDNRANLAQMLRLSATEAHVTTVLHRLVQIYLMSCASRAFALLGTALMEVAAGLSTHAQ